MSAEAAGRHIGLADLVLGGGPEYAESLVTSALEFRQKASKGTRAVLDRALDDCVRVNGFRDASRAPSGPLKAPVLDAIEEDRGNVTSALLGVWAESKPGLLRAVREYLVEIGGAPGSPNWDSRPWATVELRGSIDALMGKHEELYEPDVGLMLCLLSDRCVHSDDPVAEIRSPMLLEFLEELEGMDPDAPVWDDILRFVDAVIELDVTRVKRATALAVAAVEALVDKALADYDDELVYLDLHSQVSGWAEEAALKVWLIGEALAIVDELLERLQEYIPIRPQAATRAEEIARAPQRLAAEDGLLEVAARWRELMERPVAEDLVDSEDGWDDPADDGPTEDGDGRLMTQIEDLRGEVDRLRLADRERRAEYEAVVSQRDDLATERDSLQEEIRKLVDELSSSRETVKIWRLAGVSERMEEAGLPASGQNEPRTVKDAVTRAEKLFPDRLAVALNSKSEKRNLFQRPQEVFDALAWLAIEYHDRRANPGGSPDFDKLLKEACPGWSYKSGQTEITREQFEEWYTTTWEGRTYRLNPHLGKGTSHDPQNTIRIAFDWDDERRRVVVGYIGMHQRNRKS